MFIPSVLTHLPSLTNKHAFDEGYGQRMTFIIQNPRDFSGLAKGPRFRNIPI